MHVVHVETGKFSQRTVLDPRSTYCNRIRCAATVVQSRHDLRLPIAPPADPRLVDVRQGEPGGGAELALLDIETGVIVVHEQPLVMINRRIAGNRPPLQRAVRSHGHRAGDARLRLDVKLRALNELDGVGPQVDLHDVVGPVRQEPAFGPDHGRAKPVLVSAMHVNRTADLLVDAVPTPP